MEKTIVMRKRSQNMPWTIVFIIGLADGLFPLKRTIDEGDLEEARRLFYVAATRAQEELYLCYPMLNSLGNNIMRMNPSRFVQEIDPSLFQTLKIAPNRRWWFFNKTSMINRKKISLKKIIL